MKIKVLVSRVLLIAGLGSLFLLYHPAQLKGISFKTYLHNLNIAGGDNDKEENEFEYTEARAKHEFEMLRNPVTGRIPANFHEIEVQAASQIPKKGNYYNPLISGINGGTSMTNQNTYQSVGPNNAAGRSRALGIDRRDPNIMITGGTTGGIFRSTNGGASLNFVSSENDIRSVNSIAQDSLHPDVWYCGTGEVYYSVSTADIAGTVGWGIFKSTNNGLTWSKLTSTQDANQNIFNGRFDLVHRIAVHPVTSDVYAAVHNRIMKSSDGGITWQTVLGGTLPNSSLGGLTEVIIPSNGSKIFAAVTGENLDRSLVGVWESVTGDSATWKRIAGGPSGGTDSIPGWQPYGTDKWGRIVLALNKANTKLFVLYKNGKAADGATPQPEADLFRADISSGNPSTYTWTNLSSYVQDEPNFNEAGIDPYT